MSVIANTLSNPKIQVSLAIGGVITQTASYAFGPFSWPAWIATAAASQVFVFGLNALVDRCLQSVASRNAPQHQIQRDALPNYNGNVTEDEAMASALQASMQGNAILGRDDFRAMRSFGNCSFAEMNGDELPIPEEFFIQVGTTNRPFHAGNLVLAILSQQEPKDPFSKIPIPNETLEYLAQIMGINGGAFQSIWVNADTNPSVVDMDPDVTASNKVDNRFQQLHTLLTSNVGTREELQARRKFLDFLSEQDVWRQKFR